MEVKIGDIIYFDDIDATATWLKIDPTDICLVSFIKPDLFGDKEINLEIQYQYNHFENKGLREVYVYFAIKNYIDKYLFEQEVKKLIQSSKR